MCKDALTFQSRRVVGVRTPFLTALLDALSSALSRACMSRSCDTALLSSVARRRRQGKKLAEELDGDEVTIGSDSELVE